MRASVRTIQGPAGVIGCARRTMLIALAGVAMAAGAPPSARAQSPEISMREFSSSQIKKGVRAIGFGGDGATFGNYGLLWHEADGILADYGETQLSGGNSFNFEAAGMTSPQTWHRMTFYGIVLGQRGDGVHLMVQSPGLGTGAQAVTGNGEDLGLFGKIAVPLRWGFSIGVLISHEVSSFDVGEDADPSNRVHYQSEWRPSGGLGLAWQPNKRVLLGAREMVNNDMEYRTDSDGVMHGEVRSTEFRLGSALSPWKGAWIDTGGTSLIRSNALAQTHGHFYHPNLGFEQTLPGKGVVLRAGIDETSPTSGLTLKYKRLKLDSAYVRNMGRSRVGTLFGADSNSLLFTLTYDYGHKHGE